MDHHNHQQLSPLKRALLAISDLQREVDQLKSASFAPIAVIGMGCRFPGGAVNPRAFWKLLQQGFDAVGDVPPERWDPKAYCDPDARAQGKIASTRGGFIKGIDRFDPYFFGISPREAEWMDPQQRLLLEVSWETFEDAGLPPSRVAGSQTGVYVGILSSDYALRLMDCPNEWTAHSGTGVAHSTAVGRLSYFFDLHGPCMAIDGACASSLLAIHQAIMSLRTGECDLALAGGVNAILHPMNSILMSRLQALAPDGRCKAFDAGADGYVRGEGCGMLLLKDLAKARADGDPIRAIIRGSAVNHDGHSNGLTAPNGLSQAACLRQALEQAGVSSEVVALVETHGTGTSLGDPIEVDALKEVYGAARTNGIPLALGALKTNIGHLEPAAGVAGVIKAVLALQAGEIPPNRHFETLNPHIDLAGTPLMIPVENMPLPAVDGSRYAAVSSFGIGGCNAHVVLEARTSSVPQHDQPAPGAGPLLLPISARDPRALMAQAAAYRDHLAAAQDQRFADVCYSAIQHRTHHEHRLSVVSTCRSEAIELLGRVIDGDPDPRCHQGRALRNGMKVVFLLPGQGVPMPQLTREFLAGEPEFREALLQCSAAFKHFGMAPMDELLTAPSRAVPESAPCQQAAIFSLQVALARLWASREVFPDAVIGHSLGEVAGAHIAGALSLRDAADVVYHRARLSEKIRGKGQMAFVGISLAEAEAAIREFSDSLTVAADNGPRACVLSGAPDALAVVVQRLQRAGEFCRVLAGIDYASHSVQVEPIAAELAAALANVEARAAKVRVYSTTHDRLIGADEMGATYWADNLRRRVQFHSSVRRVLKERACVFLELSAQPTLVRSVREIIAAQGSESAVVSSLQPDCDWATSVEAAWGALYTMGANLRWMSQKQGPARYVSLPTYAWSHDRYGLPAAPPAAIRRSLDGDECWRRLEAAGRRQARNVPFDLDWRTYPDRWRGLARLSEAYMLRALRRVAGTQTFNLDAVMKKRRIDARYRKVLTRWLTVLSRSGRIELVRDGADEWRMHEGNAEDPEAILPALAKQFDDSRPYFDAVVALGSRLEGILLGQANPLEVLFPGGSLDFSVYLNRDWPPARYFNEIVRELVREFVELSPHRRLEFIEVGAGTGSTTTTVLPVLPPERVRYLHTDVSDFFARSLRTRLSSWPFLSFGTFDLEKAPQAQGYPVGAFDVVVASNSLHTTQNLGATLEHVASLLVPGGLLIAYEFTEHLPHFDITTGLLPGWQRFSDELRRDVPLLDVDGWRRALLDRGFDSVVVFPDSGSELEVLGQRVLLARRHSSRLSFSSSEPKLSAASECTESEPAPWAPRIMAGAECMPSRREARSPVEGVSALVAQLLRMPEARIEPSRSLTELGLDSLLAVELKGRLKDELALDVPVATLLAGASVADICARSGCVSPAPLDGGRAYAVAEPPPSSRNGLPSPAGEPDLTPADCHGVKREDIGSARDLEDRIDSASSVAQAPYKEHRLDIHVAHEAWPVSANARPQPELPDLGGLPRSPLESIIASEFAEVLGCPTPGVNDDFFMLGGDAATAASVTKHLGALIGLPVHPTELDQHRTPARLARAIRAAAPSQHAQGGMSPTQGSPWFVPLDRGRGDQRLFCFPFLGAGASAFAGIIRALDMPSVSSFGVQLPGRESRFLEDPYFEMEPMLAALVEAITPRLDQPYVLFGQSMGALIAFELVRALRRGEHAQPAALVVSAMQAPSKVEIATYVRSLTETRIAELANGGSRHSSIDELRQLTLPTLRADAHLLRAYSYRNEPSLNVPIIVLGGQQDTIVEPDELGHWREEAGLSFDMTIFPGGHFYLFDQPNGVLKALRRALALAAMEVRPGR